MTDTNYRPTRYLEKSNELIDRLKLAREVKSIISKNIRSFHSIHNAVDCGVVQAAFWEELQGAKLLTYRSENTLYSLEHFTTA